LLHRNNNSNFPSRTEKLVFLAQFPGMSRVMFLLFSSRRKKWREHKANKNNPLRENPEKENPKDLVSNFNKATYSLAGSFVA